MESITFQNGIEMMNYINSKGTIKPNIENRNKKTFKQYMDMTETKFKKDLELFIAGSIFIGVIVLLINFNKYLSRFIIVNVKKQFIIYQIIC